MKSNIKERLKRSEFLLSQIQIRSFSDQSKNFVKMPIALRDQIDEYFKEFPYEMQKPFHAIS
jgi:hypothetical protein